jgi:hypothetical protein
MIEFRGFAPETRDELLAILGGELTFRRVIGTADA